MVDMVFIRSENRFVVKNSNDDNSEYIEGWYEESGYGKEGCTLLIRHDMWVIHAELNQ